MSSDLEKLRIDHSLKGTAPAKRRWLRWTVAFILLAGIGGIALTSGSRAPEVEAFTVATPKSLAGDNTILNATGYIVAAHKIELAPKVMGRVEWVGVERADLVKKDQVLVRLEDQEFQARVLQAEGQLEAAKAHLAELENGSRPEEIDRAAAELEQARADLESARTRLERLKPLTATKAVSAQDLEDAQYRYDSHKARVLSLEAALSLIRKGPRIEQINAQKALVKQAEAQLLLAQNDLSNTIIKAPVTGTILARNVEVGEYVTTGFVGEGGAKGYVVSLADLGELRVELDISQDDFAKIAREQKCHVTTDAYPDRKYDGQVDLISPEANRQKATVQVRVKILKPDELLRPEMNASVAFLADPASAGKAPAVLIPATAIRDGNVYLLEGQVARKHAVQVGLSTAKGVEVRSGLSGGEQIIANPPEMLGDGQHVRVRN